MTRSISPVCHRMLITVADDTISQRNYKDSEIKEAERYKEGKPNSHLAQDSSGFRQHGPLQTEPELIAQSIEDNRTIANKLAREEKVQCRQGVTLVRSADHCSAVMRRRTTRARRRSCTIRIPRYPYVSTSSK